MKFRFFLSVLAVATICNLSHAESHGVAVQALVGQAVVGQNQRAQAEKVTPVDLKTGDITGKWKMTAEDKGKKIDIQFNLKTEKQKAKLGDAEVEYFPFSDPDAVTKAIGERNRYLGMFVRRVERRNVRNRDGSRTDKENFYVIHWVIERTRGDGSKYIYAGENSMVLDQRGNTLIMGGDYEHYELFRLTKLADSR